MSTELVNIKMPVHYYDWGTFQLKGLEKTTFRFTYDEEKTVAVIDASFFVESEPDPDKKHKRLEKSGRLYEDMQRALNEYVKGN